MIEALSYVPLAVYLLVVWGISLTTKRFYFGITVGILAVSFAAYAAISTVTLSILIAGVQGIFAIILFVILVYFLGNKASGETLLIICGSFALVPLWNGIWVIPLGLLLLITHLAFRIIKTQNTTISSVALDAAYQTGALTRSIPTFDNLPNHKENTEQRVSAAPYFLISTFTVLVIVVIKGLL